jgi:hypothetical protein
VFDIYGMAFFQRGAPESFVRAVLGTNAQEFEPGELLETYPPATNTKQSGRAKPMKVLDDVLPPGAKMLTVGVDEECVTSPPMAGEADEIFSQSYTITF